MSLFYSTSISASYCKLRWQEPYVSAGENAKAFGVMPVGIYEGFTIGPGTINGRDIVVGPGFVAGNMGTGVSGSYVSGAYVSGSGYVSGTYDAAAGYSVAVYQDVSGFQTTIQIPPGVNSLMHLDATGLEGKTVYIVLTVTYSIGNTTTAALELVDGLYIDQNPSTIVLGYVNVPASSGTALSSSNFGTNDPLYPRLSPLATPSKAGFSFAKSYQTFTQNGTFTPPAGVYRISVTTTPISKPVAMAFDATNGLSTYFIDVNNNLYAYGNNFAGGLGIGNTTAVSTPTLVLGSLTFKQIVANGQENTALGLTAGGVLYAWGNNQYGQLGIGNTTVQSSPILVLGNLTFSIVYQKYQAASAFALTPQGVAYAWGNNVGGMLGIGNNTSQSSPVAVLGGLTFSQIETDLGAQSILGLTTSGALYAWGLNNSGVLGIGNNTSQSSPVAVLGGLTFSKILMTTADSAFGLTPSGALYAWGSNLYGNLGIGNTAPQSSPVAVLGGLTFQKIVASIGGGSVLGLTPSGAVYAWGINQNGQLGIGNTTSQSSPVAVLGGLTFVDIFASGSAVGWFYGLTSSGALYAWGYNGFGELGTGDTTPRSSPVLVVGGLTFAKVYPALLEGVMGVTVDGQIYAWGNNQNGALGLNSTTAAFSSPVAVVGGHRILIAQPQQITKLTVVPGVAVPVYIQQFNATVGGVIVGQNVSSIVIEYES
jgi:alpha-tubulin suppressor-like RCC1 family protein